MFVDILIALSAGLFIHFGTQIVNFYHIFKYLDSYQKLNYFKNNNLVLTLNKFSKVKNLIINYILIPMIKINYVIISIFTSILYTLCEDDFKIFLNKKGIDTNNIKTLLKNEIENNQELNHDDKTIKSYKENIVGVGLEDKNESKMEVEIGGLGDAEINSQFQNNLLINHNFIHKINTNYDTEINNVIELENSLKNKSSRHNSSSQNNLSSPGSSSDSFGINTQIDSNSTLLNQQAQTTQLNHPTHQALPNLNLMNEIEIINRKNLKQQNEGGDELLDNYIVSESSQIKKKELEKSLNEFKSSIGSGIKSLSDYNDNKISTNPEIKEQIETIQIDEIDFGTNVNEMVEKYSKEGKIKIVDITEQKSLNVKINENKGSETKSNEIKIGKKKR